MARRRLLSEELLAPFWAWASDERTIVRHYTLSLADLDLIAKKRTARHAIVDLPRFEVALRLWRMWLTGSRGDCHGETRFRAGLAS
jgi:hypothetical protein